MLHQEPLPLENPFEELSSRLMQVRLVLHAGLLQLHQSRCLFLFSWLRAAEDRFFPKKLRVEMIMDMYF